MTLLDRPREGRANRGVRQFLLRQLAGRFAGLEARFELIHLLHRQVVGRAGALVARRGFVELLLGDELVAEKLLGATVFLLGIEQVGGCALHKGDLRRVARQRVVRPESQLRAHLPHRRALAVQLILQLGA